MSAWERHHPDRDPLWGTPHTMDAVTRPDVDFDTERDTTYLDERYERCPYCTAADVLVEPVTLEGQCPGCQRLVSYDPLD